MANDGASSQRVVTMSTIRLVLASSVVSFLLAGCSISFGSSPSSAPGAYGYNYGGSSIKPLASVRETDGRVKPLPGKHETKVDDDPPSRVDADPPAPPKRVKPAPVRTKPGAGGRDPSPTRPKPVPRPTKPDTTRPDKPDTTRPEKPDPNTANLDPQPRSEKPQRKPSRPLPTPIPRPRPRL